MGDFVTSIYWIHAEHHADMFSQGYIGISNRLQKRFSDHQKRSGNDCLKNAIAKYGWDNLIKKEILIADEKYCLSIESKLRPKDHIGWNIAMGGGKPPVAYGNQSRLGKPSWNKGLKGVMKAWNKGLKLTEEQKATPNLGKFKKGQIAPNKGKKRSPELVEAHRILMTGRKITEEHKQKISKGLIGRVVNEESRKKISVANLNRPLIQCPHCVKMGDIGSMTRWHFDNCKFKEAICL